jgi:uncharacterized protein YbjT (DUF2867 family)
MPKNTKRLILVTGATGHQGGAVLKQLQKKGFPVRILTRDPTKPEARKLVGSGTEVSKGDLDDQATLTRALDGVYGVYSVQAANFADPESEVRQGINLAAAAARSRISHLVYSSAVGADKKTGVPHFESKFRIEEHIRGTGTPYTILRPAFFMENWMGMKDQLDKGVIAFPMRPETRLQMIAVADIGGVAVTAFERPGLWHGRAVELAGDEMSFHELAETFSRVLGHPVEYQQVPWDQFEQQAGHEITVMFRWMEDVGFHIDIAALRQEYPDLMTFERWLHSHFLGSRIATT